MNTPCSQSSASVTSGTTVERRPPKSIASIGTPAGSSHSGRDRRVLRRGRREARVGVRRRGARGRGPVVAVPVGQVRRGLLGHALPPHVAVVGERAVGEDRVALDRVDRVGVGVLARPRRHTEEARLGVDRVEAAVLAELHPRDVVADRLHRPALERRDQHREVGLAAGADGKAPAMYLTSPSGEVSLRISMCSAIQPSSRAITEAMRSAKHFLPSSALPP